MFKRLKQTWCRLRAGSPGRRFQEQFRHRQQASLSLVRKVFVMGGGILLMAGGLFFLFVPGPGLLFLLLGGVLIAQHSFPIARAFDWIEIQVRKLLGWSRSM